MLSWIRSDYSAMFNKLDEGWSKEAFIKDITLSLGDTIDLEQKLERFRNGLRFQQKIQDKFGSGFLIVVTNV